MIVVLIFDNTTTWVCFMSKYRADLFARVACGLRLLLVHPFPTHLVRSDPRLPPTRCGPVYIARELPAEVAGVPAHPQRVAVLPGDQIGANLIFSRLIVQ